MSDGWDGGRTPLGDAAAEEARKEAYWAWLDANPPDVSRAKGAFAGYAVRAPRYWRRLDGPDAADHEALRMRHSIGHSWGIYGSMGEVYSLRDGSEVPQVTVLVVDGAVVHAREERNSRLSPRNRALLEEFAQTRGWEVRDDSVRFEVMRDPDEAAVNTRVTLLHRPASGDKEFFSFVAEGRFSDEDVQNLHNHWGPDPLTAPSLPAAWLPEGALPAGAPEDQEILSIRHTREPATVSARVSETLPGMLEKGPAGPGL